MSRVLSLLLLIAALAVTGCAHSLPAPGDARVEFDRKVAERMKEEEGIFDVLSSKMDEYQDLMDACDRISPAAEEHELKASCALRLKAMREELSELSDLLRDGR